ncbi:RNA polymerase subunit sigma [Lysinibacillus sp. KU-BSD001]|uniref:RNA polymerase subunit sigma n=1 Tax=Lysinibacillus sp. KU-BSD001 TaxID=3141328 RepID=UPI0036EBF5D2
MSLKGVELQIAIPKTFDAGKMVEQHQQNTINQQIHANEALKKELDRKQTTVNETDSTDAITDEEERQGDAENPSMLAKKKKKVPEAPKAQHPFKGNFIDFSG